jgi:hypothetical protein
VLTFRGYKHKVIWDLNTEKLSLVAGGPLTGLSWRRTKNDLKTVNVATFSTWVKQRAQTTQPSSPTGCATTRAAAKARLEPPAAQPRPGCVNADATQSPSGSYRRIREASGLTSHR